MQAPAALLVLLVLTGCAAPPPDAAPVHAPVAGTLQATPECRYACFEPSLAVSADGVVYVTAGSEGVFRGEPTEGGYLWSNVTPPDPAFEGFNGPGDRIVQVSPDGVVVVSELLVTQTGVRGVRVSSSPDDGATWVETLFSNAFLSAPSHDRQWVAFGDGGRIGVIYKDQRSGLYLHRSTDAGATFDEGVVVATQEVVQVGGPVPIPGASIIAGEPAYQGEDVLVPFFHHGLLMISRVGNVPAVERPVVVDGAPAQGSFFPRVVVDADGSIVLAWLDEDARLAMAQSSDGQDWQTLSVPDHGPLTSSPWLAEDATGRLHVAWTEGALGQGRMMHASRDGDGWRVTEVGRTVGTEARPGHTDFAHFVLDGTTALFAMARQEGAGLGVVPIATN